MTAYARKMRNTAHHLGHHPETLTEKDLSDLRMAREWIDSILEGKSLDVADVYYRAYRDVPEYREEKAA